MIFPLGGARTCSAVPLVNTPPEQILFFFYKGSIVMSFYGIVLLFLSAYLWCSILWNVGIVVMIDSIEKKE
ncbi:hypothetical protein RHMOL_Rhmol11G0150200 [Rhododendron molle]|uniref:Uncharacterized protein n=1 Tax=Rhododendron molle TaxID=49168 RepID=A0ACC0LSI0_RHOML|nr:hypothetical protein RHMOL_Rhmol11G0150200 [Rhododendron molle]